MAGRSVTIPLSELCTRITKGTTPTTLGRPFVDRGINFVKSEAITDDGRIDTSTFAFIDIETHKALDRSILQEGDVLFSMAGVYLGKTAVVPRDILPANTNQAVGIIRLDHAKAVPRFIHYVLSSPDCRGLVHRSVAQSAQPNFNLRDIGSLPVPVLPLGDQRAIAHILGTLDDKIELNWRMNETLEAIVRALFKSWFVDFDPVRAKMEGRWRKSESLPGLPGHLWDLFPARLVDSELGGIPEGWEVESLDEIAHFLNGLALQKYTPGDGPTLPVIKIAQLRKGDTERADECNMDITADYIVGDGDVLFSWSGSLECVLWSGGTGALNQHLFKVTSQDYPKWFYYFWIHEHLPTFRYIAAGKATTMGHIQRQHLTDSKVVVPGADTMTTANRLFSTIVERILGLRFESRTLATLRNTLLPKLVSGELEVPEIEISGEGAA